MPVEGNQFHSIHVAEIAAKLNITEAVLRKQLQSEGTCVRTISEDIRCDIACTRLRSTHASIEAIAEELGYKETRSFTRACGVKAETPYIAQKLGHI